MEHKCIFCDTPLTQDQFTECASGDILIDCPVCGLVAYSDKLFSSEDSVPQDKNKLAAFLYYHSLYNGIPRDDNRYPIYYLGTKEEFDERCNEGQHLIHITDEIVENWYPRIFNEKVNLILLALANKSRFFGARVILNGAEKTSCLFIQRYSVDNKTMLHHDAMASQIAFISGYLKNAGLIDRSAFGSDGSFACELSPQGWQRVDELQKHQAESSKTAFVAMSFAKEMDHVRDAIKQAITACGYVPRIMDEIEHNHQIVPEMLYEIRQARFVIAELTGHNNGAYYEAGYALGLGKEIIHVCKHEQFGADGHFDVKQVNTVLWNNEKDLADKLSKRIRATIE